MRKNGMELRFSAKGATAEDVERAEAAAWVVFEEAGVNPRAAATAAFKLEGYLEFDLEPVTDEESAQAIVWRNAIYEAGLAYFGVVDYQFDTRNEFDFELVRE